MLPRQPTHGHSDDRETPKINFDGTVSDTVAAILSELSAPIFEQLAAQLRQSVPVGVQRSEI